MHRLKVRDGHEVLDFDAWALSMVIVAGVIQIGTRQTSDWEHERFSGYELYEAESTATFGACYGH